MQKKRVKILVLKAVLMFTKIGFKHGAKSVQWRRLKRVKTRENNTPVIITKPVLR